MKINLKQLKDNATERVKKNINAFYVTILIIVFTGTIILAVSSLFEETAKNIMIGLGTGIITSALVTFLVDLTNKEVEKKQRKKYRRILLAPLSRAIQMLYGHTINNLNKYKMYDENKPGNYIFLPCNDTRVLSEFFKQLQALELKLCSEEKKKKLNEMIDVYPVWYENLISQYRTLPLETLLLDNVISKEEYNELKSYAAIETCEKYISFLEKNDISEQERYVAAMLLMKISLNIMNKLIFMFDFIEQKISEENERIKRNLDCTWHFDYYVYSDEYISGEIEKSQHPQEEYAVLEESEENAVVELHNRLMLAIFMDDVDEMKSLFPDIDKNNKIMQKELTSESAKTVMKDKELRKMYREKYGAKYVLRK